MKIIRLKLFSNKLSKILKLDIGIILIFVSLDER